MEDANFESGNAEAGILRLFTLIEWVKEMIDPEVKLREGGEMTFHDKVSHEAADQISVTSQIIRLRCLLRR